MKLTQVNVRISIDAIDKALKHGTRVREYQEWIEKNVSKNPNDVLQTCEEATLKMKEVFPELQRIRGLVHTTDQWGDKNKYPHWWLIDPWDNDIIDPTVLQFCLCTILGYIPIDENRIPTGKCPNCGDVCYDNEYLCSDECSKEYGYYIETGEL